MRPKTWLLTVGIASLGILAWPSMAQAHSPIAGIGTFYSYMLHPLVVPAHALLLLATALMLGQQSRKAARISLVLLLLGFASGLAISGAGALGGVPERVLLAGALVMGGAVILGRHWPVSALVPAVAAAGFAIGLDSAPEPSNDQEISLAFSGLACGFIGVATIITGLTIGLSKDWQRIGVRIAGSWIVAISMLVLALSMAAQSRHPSAATVLAWGRSSSC